MIRDNFYLYLLAMGGTTYLIRMIPLILVKKKIENRFLVSFLHYIPASVLTIMTIPSIFYATSFVPAVIGFLLAVILAYIGKSLVTVAASASLGVIVTELIIKYLL